jgi:hypothetical protein
MEPKSDINELLRKAYDPALAGYKAPPVTNMRARRYVSRSTVQRSDLLSRIAFFLNNKVRFTDAVIGFAVIWLAVLLFGSREKIQPVKNKTNLPYVSNFAASQNSAAPACLQTYELKK